jgi:16S rRNA (guanine1207-N2)-methyltransferase
VRDAVRSLTVSEDHYFSAQPASPDQRRVISVMLAGEARDVETAPGVFSPGHIDLGTSVLLRHVPPPPAGDVLDLGCGWGPLALTAALLEPAARVTAVDVNERALDLLRRNAERLSTRTVLAPIEALTPGQVPAEAAFDALWSNPPIRVGKDALHDLLTRWIPRVRSGGDAYLVVHKHLGADSLATWLSAQTDDAGLPWGSVEKLGSAKGFRVLHVART